jgi:general secretion pathway protein H
MTCQRNRSRGFTLIEILAVISIMAAISVMVVVQVVGRLDSVKISGAGREIAAALRFTRGQALVQQLPQAVLFDVEERSYIVPGREKVILPKGVDLQLFTATAELIDDKTGSIRFYPDGGSTGGSVTLKSNGREWKVLVGWLTGEIKFEDTARKRAAR